MKKQPKTQIDSDAITALSISAFPEDHLSLQSIIGHSRWQLFRASDLESAIASLERHAIAVLLCERDLRPGAWTNVLE